MACELNKLADTITSVTLRYLVSRDLRTRSADLYWISPFGPVHWKRADRCFLSRWFRCLLADARRNAAAGRTYNPELRQVWKRPAGPSRTSRKALR